MPSQTLEIVRHVLWTSVTGGWFYDPSQHDFVNITQLYFWLLLFVCPLLLSVLCMHSAHVWALYCVGVFVVFVIGKLVNYQLHNMFDTSLRIDNVDKRDAHDTQAAHSSGDCIEMSVLVADTRQSARDGGTSTCLSTDGGAGTVGTAAATASGTMTGSVDSDSAHADIIDHQADVHRSATAINTHEHHVLEFSSVSCTAAAVQYCDAAGAARTTSGDYEHHHIDQISELPEEDVCDDPSVTSYYVPYHRCGVATSVTVAQQADTGQSPSLNLVSTAGATVFSAPATRNNGQDISSSAVGSVAATSGAVFDLPSFLHALRERMQVTLTPLTFRRTLSVTDARAHASSGGQVGGGAVQNVSFVDLNSGRSLIELPASRTADDSSDGGGRTERSGSLTVQHLATARCDPAMSPARSDPRLAAEATTASNHSGSEDDAKDSDSPLLDGSSSRFITSDDVSAINVWVKDASEATSTCNTASLHSLVGVGRLFGDCDDDSLASDVVSLASRGATAALPCSVSTAPVTVERCDSSCSASLAAAAASASRSRTGRRSRTGSSVSVSSMPSRWSAAAGHRRRAIRIRDPQRGGSGASRPPRASSPHSSQCRRRRCTAALPPLPSSADLAACSSSTGCFLPPPPPPPALQQAVSRAGSHLAESHDDTSSGAVHYFQDEFGNWMTYTFNEAGFASSVPATDSQWSLGANAGSSATAVVAVGDACTESDVYKSAPSPCSSPVMSAAATSHITNCSLLATVATSGTDVTAGTLANVDRDTVVGAESCTSAALHIPAYIHSAHALRHADSVVCGASDAARVQTVTDKGNDKPSSDQHYRLSVWGDRLWMKVRFERLALLSLMDRNVLVLENVVSVLLAVLAAVLASAILCTDIFTDLGVVFFVLSLASCQYCLMKSVQPDAASPTHGHNRLVVYSRAVYFCLLCAATLMLRQCRIHYGSRQLHVYGATSSVAAVCRCADSITCTMLLLLPLLCAVGLLPQVDTFVHYLLEQLDRHVMGGTASTGLPAALYGLMRSVLCVVALYGLAYGGLRENGVDALTAQHILFSIYCGLTVAVAYHLSRSTSDPTQLWRVVRRYACVDLDDVVATVTVKSSHPSTVKTAGDESPATVATSDAAVDRQMDSAAVDGHNASGDHASVQCDDDRDQHTDPLPALLLQTVRTRLKSDALACTITAVLLFAVHCSTVFSSLRPMVSHVLCGLTVAVGVLSHYVVPHLRQQLPWLCLAHPILTSAEHRQYDVHGPARVMWFERALVWCVYLERHVLFPLVFLSALTTSPPHLVSKLGLEWASLVVVVCALKNLRSAYTDPGCSYLVLLFTVLLFNFDLVGVSETFLVDYFVVAIVFDKVSDLLLKLQFVITYIAPWQITWGSAFHAFAQPFSVPHSAILLAQAVLSAVLSSPLNPFLGSAVFIVSYVRPIKFWERNYNTRRVDHSNTRLSLHLERNPGANDSNLNSIFYEHLTRSLQKSLCGDILLGRWGEVRQGDCFVLASDYLNCLVHIIELANGLVTFQVRGLEFRGTYCQQREVEAISEGVEEDAGCCCCDPGHLPHFLSVNQVFNQRWLAWQVLASKYVLEGYSISDNSASSMLQLFDLRKVLVCYYVKSIIYYAVRSPSLHRWLSSSEIMSGVLEHTSHADFVDVDPIFNMNIDEDYDFRASGITRQSFVNVYYEWISYCVQRRSDSRPECTASSPVVLLCLALSLLGRRALCVATHHSHSSVEFFLYGLHALFKGDFRITSLRDEWVFYDMDLLKKVVAPAIRMSLKLHQDHFMSPDDYELPQCLFDAIQNHDTNLVIAHEGDPSWRTAILSGAPSLLALRHLIDESTDHYKVIMLNKRHLSFRLIKLNRECVRGLWSGQQQELIYLRNRNPERGSIQNARQALRNIINSSCDQPIGYPIYVSPLTTSYSETNDQLTGVIGRPISFDWVQRQLLSAWQRLCAHCGESCASSGSVPHEQVVHFTARPCVVHLASAAAAATTTQPGGHCSARLSGTFPSHTTAATDASIALIKQSSRSLPPSITCGCSMQLAVRRPADHVSLQPSSSCVSTGTRPASHRLCASVAHTARPTRPSVSPLRQNAPPPSPQPRLPAAGLMPGACVRVSRGEMVIDSMNLGRPSDAVWPDERWRRRGGKNHWGHWLPDGRTGCVVHFWSPSHPQLVHRCHLDKVILLVEIDARYVPVDEAGCVLLDVKHANSTSQDVDHTPTSSIADSAHSNNDSAHLNTGSAHSNTNSADSNTGSAHSLIAHDVETSSNRSRHSARN